MGKYTTHSHDLYDYLIAEGHTAVEYNKDENGKYWWTWEHTDKLTASLKKYFDNGGYTARKHPTGTHTVRSLWLKNALIEKGHELVREAYAAEDYTRKVYLFVYSQRLLNDIDELIKEKQMEDKKYYKTLSRGMMNFLVERGHTDIKYEQNERGKIVFCWEETNKLNKDIKLFYETDREVDRRKRAKVVGTPWLVRELSKLGYESFATEVSIFDWRKKVYLYDKSNSLQEAIDRLLAERNNNMANFLEDEDAKR